MEGPSHWLGCICCGGIMKTNHAADELWVTVDMYLILFMLTVLSYGTWGLIPTKILRTRVTINPTVTRAMVVELRRFKHFSIPNIETRYIWTHRRQTGTDFCWIYECGDVKYLRTLDLSNSIPTESSCVVSDFAPHGHMDDAQKIMYWRANVY